MGAGLARNYSGCNLRGGGGKAGLATVMQVT